MTRAPAPSPNSSQRGRSCGHDGAWAGQTLAGKGRPSSRGGASMRPGSRARCLSCLGALQALGSAWGTSSAWPLTTATERPPLRWACVAAAADHLDLSFMPAPCGLADWLERRPSTGVPSDRKTAGGKATRPSRVGVEHRTAATAAWPGLWSFARHAAAWPGQLPRLAPQDGPVLHAWSTGS